MYYTIKRIRTDLTAQGWDVISTNTLDGRYYHAEHRILKRTISGRKDQFKHDAIIELSQFQ